MDSPINLFLKLPGRAWVVEQLKNNLKPYETRVRELVGVVEKLNKKRDAIQRTINEERRHDKEIDDKVKEWIEVANHLLAEYDDFNGDNMAHKHAVFDLFQSGRLPKPGIRIRRRRKAYDITRRVNELLKKAKFESFSYWSGPPSMAAFFTNVGYESYPSREETISKIIAELEKPSARMVGVYGHSGVGKTTLVKEVANVALDENMFDVVIMVSITKTPDIRKIQGHIADMLGLILNEESDIARAAKIQKILKNEKKSTLIILDDLFEKMELNMLGIPNEIVNDDVKEGKSLGAGGLKDPKGKSSIAHSMADPNKHPDPSDKENMEETLSQYKGCKILMISERKQVLSSQMEQNENSIFSLEVLEEKEAEMLFKKLAVKDQNSESAKLAAQIAKKCKGLPMSIVTTARALKNKSNAVWEDTNRKLEWQNLTGAPEYSTKLSYNLLDEELKYTFLLCARMGQDALIMDLVKYCIGLGFLEGIYTVRQTRDRVYTLVGKLKESGLLSESYSSDHFTMQDTVRSAALSIARKENRLFTMTKGKIDEWPDKLEKYAAISFHRCEFIEEFPERINYPRLRVFHLTNDDPNLKIPKNFFKGMKELRLLTLTGIDLSLFQWPISSMEKLRMLCLEKCKLHKELSFVGKLKNLRILSFAGSDIEKLPVELAQLKKLQIFDISNCSELEEITSGVISSLVSLEELYMRNTLIHRRVGEATHPSKLVILSELKHLNQLTTLDIQIPEVSGLPKNLFFDQLYSYKIVIGNLTSYFETDFKMPEKYETLRFLAIQLNDEVVNIHSLQEIKMMFEKVENLFLEELKDVEDIFYGLSLKGFPCLKHLQIVNNSNIQSLIQPKDRKKSRHPEKAFPKLESLYLYNLEKMNQICSCELSAPSFGKLKVIKISLCGKLKNVFSVSVVKLLTVLETIEVSECNSLVEIVSMETTSNIGNEGTQSTDEVKQLMFPELRFLKLQSLSQFNGFYPISSRKEKELFNEKIEVSKLETMELSSISIDIIWSKHHSSQSSSFKNLTQLDVNGCSELKYLIPFSMAKCLISLQSLFVSDCEMMAEIFIAENNSQQEIMGSIFPKLKNIKLSRMKNLSKIWDSEYPLSDSFSKLDTLIIEECDKLIHVFPSYIKEIFQNLCSLRVTNCSSMQVIFKIHEQVEDVANLQDVHLEKLPKLKHVWILNEDRVGNFKCNNLQRIRVQQCYSLEHLFPYSIAKCLDNLEYLVVCECFQMEEIVAKSKAANTDKELFHFPKLSTIEFSDLPQLTSFYGGARTYDLLCPKLNDLSIELCDKLEPFNENGPVLFPEKVINGLKCMQIESWHAKSTSSYMAEGNHRRDNLEELCLSRLVDTEILYSFLRRNPNLESLSLNNCFFEEIVPLKNLTEIENLGVVPKLKSLKLINLFNLKGIGFEPDIILKRVESLILKNCRSMTTVLPSTASLSSLTNLEVVNCDGLENLMSPSTAKSLVQLTTMKVTKCGSLTEIVGKEDGENAGKVVFKQLKALELVSLEKLNSFCSSGSYDFEFPSLETLVVSACYKMEKFSKKVASTPILQNICVVHEKEKKRLCWKGDLNATIETIFKDKKFFDGMEVISLFEHPDLQGFWQGRDPLQNSWFCSLKILKLVNCEKIQSCAIPSNVLPYLKSLKELQVQDCKNVKVIFEMNVKEDAGTAFQLQKLDLKRLPKLTQVWNWNGQKGTQSFQYLQEVFVADCCKLPTMFPVAVAKNLKKLDVLCITYCKMLREIVGKEEDTETQEFVLPCLTKLYLLGLPKLIGFYPKSFTLECSVLDGLFVLDCPKLELFESSNRQSRFLDLEVIFNLEVLIQEWNVVLKLFQPTVCLEYLINIGLSFDDERPILPIEIIQKVPNLKHMTIKSCRCPEEFNTRISDIDVKMMLTCLKTLALRDVWKLKYIGSGNVPWLDKICTKLHRLSFLDCPHLTAVLHSTSAVTFSHLKRMGIFNCNRLKYLFTSSTAKAFIQLEQIRVMGCKSIKEIVAKEQDEEASGEVKLLQLHSIHLYKLSNLECFYSGNHTLQLPSLIQVSIDECPKMEIFSQGSIGPNSCREVRTFVDPSNRRLAVFHDDLNSSVKKVFLHQNHIVFGDSRMLQEIWRSESVEHWFFCYLTSIVVEGCEFLSDAILPTHLLHLLRNLKKLRVRKCNSLKAIFSMGPQGSLSSLEQLHVENCQELEAIVAKDKADNEEANKEIAIFSNITSLRLSCLPNLSCLYPGMHTLKWQKLKELHVENCQKLKLFATEIQNPPDSNPDDQGRFSTEQQATGSLEKESCLEVMSLGKEEAMVIEQGKLHIDLPKLKSLKLHSFHDEQGDVVPFVFGSKVSVSLPTIENLGLPSKRYFPLKDQVMA